MATSDTTPSRDDAIRVLIAEDEPVPRRRIARLLSEEPDVHVVAQCQGGEDTVQRIREEHPDVVFLDVQMPDLDGFGVIDAIGPAHMPLVVFVTAYDAHAVRAFDLYAADYVLKPYDPDRLRTAMERVRARLRAGTADGTVERTERAARDAQRLRELLQSLGVATAERTPATHDQLVVRADGSLRVLRMTEIDWFETEGNYVRVHVAKESWLLRQTAANLEARLDPRQFARIHRRYIVNLKRVFEIQPWFGGDAIVVMRDGRQLRLSRSFRERFHARFLSDAEETATPPHTDRHMTMRFANARPTRTARTRLPLLTLALSAPLAPLHAQSTPAMFRGDAAHTGYQAGSDATTIVGLRWRVPTSGGIVATPLVADGRVLIGSGDGTFYAIDRDSGVVRWRYDAASPIQSSAAAQHGLVFFGSRDGAIHALDARTGQRRWRVTTGPALALPWGHESGDVFTSSPVLAGGMLLIGGGDGVLRALDPSTGATRWTARTGGRLRGTPAVASGMVFVGAFDGRVYAFDLATGAARWRADTQGAALDSRHFGFDRRSIQSSPAVAFGTVYVGARDGFLYALDAATGAPRWTVDHQVSWINASPAVHDGVVYVGSSDAHFLQAVAASTGTEQWRAKSTSTVWASATVTDRVVYWTDGAGVVHATDRATGAERSAFFLGAQTHSSPVVDGDLLVVGCSDGGIYALALGDSTRAVRRAVFFDSSYLRIAHEPSDAARVARVLASRGYATLAAADVVPFLRDRVADGALSVLVFAIDAVPDSALGGDGGAGTLLRRYLARGGKIVWSGFPPTIWPVEPLHGERHGLDEVVWDAPTRLLGVSFAESIFDQRTARATPLGVRWGLPLTWRQGWSVARDGVTDVLAVDDFGLAAAWAKRYGGAEGTGFVYVPQENPQTVYLAAEFRPERR